MRKRLLALAAAAVAALALGGVNLAGHAGTARADGPSGYGNTPGIAVGCVNSLGGTASTAIQFNATTLQQVATPALSGTPSNVNNTFYLTTPGNDLLCGVVLQGSTTPAPLGSAFNNPGAGQFDVSSATCTGTAPNFTCTQTTTVSSDGNPNTVDAGTITYTLNGGAGRFVIRDSNSNTITLPCNSNANPSYPNGLEGCQGAVPGSGAGNISPNPALVIKVGLAPGVPLSAFGTLPAAGFTFNLTAQYTRTAGPVTVTTTCTINNIAICTFNPANFTFLGTTYTFTGIPSGCLPPLPTMPPSPLNTCTITITLTLAGPSTASASVNLNLVAPTYAMYVLPNPATIAVAPATVNLVRGCNKVITPATLAANSQVSAVVNLVSPSSAVVSVWQYNNATQKFNALFFNTPQAPVDRTTVSGSQSVFICVSSTASYQTGTY